MIRPRAIIVILAGVLALAWWMVARTPTSGVEQTVSDNLELTATEQPAKPAASQSSPEAPSQPASPNVVTSISDEPVDAVARARFNERARDFFARAPGMSMEAKQREASEIERELSRMEQAGGMSAGETFLLRAGLIRETVQDQAQEVAQIKALKQRYEAEAQRRTAAGSTRPDPAFESYKVRESQIVAEVAAM